MLLLDDFYAIVFVVAVFIEGDVFGWRQNQPVLILNCSLANIGFIVVCIWSKATIVRVINVNVRVGNVNIFSFVCGDVSRRNNELFRYRRKFIDFILKGCV